ncbi:GNAT family N-acetyltransferase [Asticcacaulis sp. DXS10W]|uniref:GNAT family N-acetyltransferase n=1 Tax=Asticcacaulis currens TaxID=2984210 RepID=A0ABT5IDK5_9CAUL|nr:GNAT family N-acetyltransferase [Asticcacaulis currens]MDC7694229.1 GNAT family N-acetyltransferase [Asticcacaulis currens]
MERQLTGKPALPEIIEAATDEEILKTFEVMSQLHPHLDQSDYLRRIRELMGVQGYRLVSLYVGSAPTVVAGFRLVDTLFAGRTLHVDDFVTFKDARSLGYGAKLLEWLRIEAKLNNCRHFESISKITHEDAHRFYVREGFDANGFSFRKTL